MRPFGNLGNDIDSEWQITLISTPQRWRSPIVSSLSSNSAVIITEHNGEIVWHDFGYERDWDGREPFEGIGPFMFQKLQYIGKIEEGIHRSRLGRG